MAQHFPAGRLNTIRGRLEAACACDGPAILISGGPLQADTGSLLLSLIIKLGVWICIEERFLGMFEPNLGVKRVWVVRRRT